MLLMGEGAKVPKQVVIRPNPIRIAFSLLLLTIVNMLQNVLEIILLSLYDIWFLY
jgi:hypothetical protein